MNKKSCVAGINSCQTAGRAKKSTEVQKMRNKKYSLPIVTAFLLLMLAGVVSAGTCTFVSPGASAVLSGASNTLIINTSVAPVQNCTVTASSTASGGSFTVGTFTNSTNVTFNGTYSTAGQRDAGDWAFSATCINSTGATVDTCSRTGLTIDNTVPTVSGCLIGGSAAASGTVDSSDETFACTVKNATSCAAYWKTAVALTFTTGTASRSDMSLSAFTASSSYGASGTTLTANLKNVEDSAYNTYFICTDGRNSTTGTSYSISLEGYSKKQEQQKNFVPQQVVQAEQQAQNKEKGVMLFIIIGAAAIVIIGGYIIMQKKNK